MATSKETPTPVAQGDLAQTPFAHVALYIDQRQLSGTLVFWEPDRSKTAERILFQKGDPIAARLSHPTKDLARGLLPLFAKENGPFAFYEDHDLLGDKRTVTGHVKPKALVAASLRGSSRDDQVHLVLANFGDACVRLERGVDFSTFELLPDERRFFDLVRARPAPIAELTAQSELNNMMAERLLYLMAITKHLNIYDGMLRGASVRPGPPDTAKGQHPNQKQPAIPEEPTIPRAPKAPKLATETDTFPTPPSGLSAEHRQRWRDIRERSKKIEGENYFEMLHVERSASNEDIQKAYLKAVKVWHPDRLAKELHPLRTYCERVFEYLTRAQDVLCDENRRGQYLVTVQDGGGTPESERQVGKVIHAAIEFRKVEVHLKRRQWSEALQQLDPILALSPDEPDYLSAKAWAEYQQNPTNKDVSRSALETLSRALETSEEHELAHFYRGNILKRLQRLEEAIPHFRRASELNPRNIEAAREVRLAEMRGRDGSAKTKPKEETNSIFSKLFSKKK